MRYHLDLIGGLAGDMFLAAAIDAKIVDLEALRDGLRTLGLGKEIEIRVTRGRRGALAGSHVSFANWDASAEADHRYLSTILKMIDESNLPDRVKGRASSLFMTLGRSEAAVHGMTLEEVHFHEVGAVDSILDFVSAAWIVESDPESCWSVGKIPTGSGTVKTAHGEIPVPVPAAMNLLVGFTLTPSTLAQERITPTGAALLADLKRDGRLVQVLGGDVGQAELLGETKLHSIGYGLGTKDFGEVSNAVRLSCYVDAEGGEGEISVVLGEENEDGAGNSTTSTYTMEEILKLTCEVDDMQPEILAYVCETVLPSKGAIDVVRTPVVMKSGRMGTQLQVLAPLSGEKQLVTTILEETTTLGVRVERTKRAVLPRRTTQVTTPWGDVGVKIVTTPQGVRRVLEYRTVVLLAEAHHMPLQQMWQKLLQEIGEDETNSSK